MTQKLDSGHPGAFLGHSVASLEAVLDYEIAGSWWAKLVSWNWAQELAASYFARKVARKYARYKESVDMEALIGSYPSLEAQVYCETCARVRA